MRAPPKMTPNAVQKAKAKPRRVSPYTDGPTFFPPSLIHIRAGSFSCPAEPAQAPRKKSGIRGKPLHARRNRLHTRGNRSARQGSRGPVPEGTGEWGAFHDGPERTFRSGHDERACGATAGPAGRQLG